VTESLFLKIVSIAKTRCSTDQRSIATKMLWISLEGGSRTNSPRQWFHSQLCYQIIRYFYWTLYNTNWWGFYETYLPKKQNKNIKYIYSSNTSTTFYKVSTGYMFWPTWAIIRPYIWTGSFDYSKLWDLKLL
jgi:hypothetical protein